MAMTASAAGPSAIGPSATGNPNQWALVMRTRATRLVAFSLRRLSSSTRVGDESFAKLGDAYERRVQQVLQDELGIVLRVVGGCGDGGRDLVGSWPLVPGDDAQRLIVQCKHKVTGRLSSAIIREFDGTMSRETAGSIGIMATNIPPSAAALLVLCNSPFPMIMTLISTVIDGTHPLREVCLNHAFRRAHPAINPCRVRRPFGHSYTTFNLRQQCV